MAALSCPACGAEVPLRSAAMPYAVCGYCHSVLLRQGEGLSDIGKSAVLPFDVSPIQLGTRGTVGALTFEVVGRVRWGWQDGSWNEWLLSCGDGKARWLGEATGEYMLLTERPELDSHPLVDRFARGEAFRVGDRVDEFSVTDVKEARCLGGEGDLPFPTPTDWTMTSIDFRDAAGGALSVQRDAQGVMAYAGVYLSLAELNPRNLRAIDGWPMPPGYR